MAGFRRKKDDQSDTPKKKITKSDLKKSLRLFKYVKPYKNTFAIGFVFLLLSSVTSMVFPYLTGKLVDSSNSEMLKEINTIALALLGVFAANAVFSYFRIYLFWMGDFWHD